MEESLGHYDEAEALYGSAILGAKQRLGLAHSKTQLYMRNALGLFQKMKKPEAAEPLLRDLAEFQKEKSGPESQKYAGLLEQWSWALLDRQQFDAAEPKLRECLALRQKIAPDDWSRFYAQSQLGACLAGQKKFADAEPMLLAGYQGLKTLAAEKKLPAAAVARHAESARRLVELYAAWEKPEQVVEWQTVLDELQPQK